MSNNTPDNSYRAMIILIAERILSRAMNDCLSAQSLSGDNMASRLDSCRSVIEGFGAGYFGVSGALEGISQNIPPHIPEVGSESVAIATRAMSAVMTMLESYCETDL